ncbi:MAG: WG repeat-containing protein [Clostridia bacterium]
MEQYDFVGEFREELAAVQKGQYWGFINKKGEEVIPCQYEWTNDFENGIAPVKLCGKYAFINKDGSFATEFKYDDACNCCGRARILLKRKGKTGYLNGYIDPDSLEEHWFTIITT